MKFLSVLKYIFVGFISISVAIADVSDKNNEQAKSMSLEDALVLLDTGNMPKKDDIKAARFKALLDMLNKKYIGGKDGIADSSQRAQGVLKKYGVSETIMNIMEIMNEVANERISKSKLKYDEAVVLFVMLKKENMDNKDIIKRLAALLNKVE